MTISNLKRIRRELHVSTRQLAERANVRPEIIVSIERGRPPRADTLERIAAALGVPVTALLDTPRVE